MVQKSSSVRCLACDKEILDPTKENMMGEEYLCDACREEMFASLEDAWKKHSAFLDSALN
jgi:hypothetical protein